MASANAIPRVLQMSASRPNATQAYSREFRVYPVNGTSFADQGTIRINIDTSTPGAWLDPNLSYLQFDFTVSRSNGSNYGTASNTATSESTTWRPRTAFSVSTEGTLATLQPVVVNVGGDKVPPRTYQEWNESARYYRLPNCGAHAFIQEFRIYVQGVPIEEIVDYNLTCELMHDLNGIPSCRMQNASTLYYASSYPRQKHDGLDAESVIQDDRIMNNNYIQELRLGATYRCQIQFLSGVFGSLAEKMFPSLLVAPGSMYIELRLASANNACVSYVTQKLQQTMTDNKYIGCTVPSTDTASYYTGQSNFAATQMFVSGSADYGDPATLEKYDPNTVPRVRKIPATSLKANNLAVAITNVQMVCRQIVLTDSAASAIISRAASSDISIHTNSFRVYGTEATSCLQNASGLGVTLQLLIPAKIASANSLFVIFRDRRQSNDATKECYKRQAIGLESQGNQCSYQLRIGNELIPQTPISTPNEAMMQLLRAMHDYPNTAHTSVLGQCKQTGWLSDNIQTDFSHPLIQYPCAGWLTLQREGRPVWRDQYTTTIYDTTAKREVINPDYTTAGANGYIHVGEYDATGTATPAAQVNGWYANHGHNFQQVYGVTWEPYFYSTFAIGFDLDNFQNNVEVMRSGKYLGNNTVQLLLNGCKVSPVDMANTTDNALVNYIVGHDVRLSFQAGGIVQSFY